MSGAIQNSGYAAQSLALATQFPNLRRCGLLGWVGFQVPAIRGKPLAEFDVSDTLSVAAFVP